MSYKINEVSSVAPENTSKESYEYNSKLQKSWVDYKSISIITLLEKFNISLPGIGSNYFQIPCPFHSEKKPSLTIYPKTNSFYCFGCNRSGNVIQFVMEFLKLEFSQALKWSSEHFPQYVENRIINKSHQSYVLRSICNHRNAQRYLVVKEPSSLIFRPVFNDDRIGIREIINKNYLPKNLEISDTKICTGFHSWPNQQQQEEFSYSLATPIKKGFYYEQNPYGLTVALHVEGLTDYLTAIEMSLFEEFGIIGEHSKFRHTFLESDTHYFILDDDTDSNEFRHHLIRRLKRPIIVKFIQLHGYKDLSDFFVFGGGTRNKLKEIIKATKAYPLLGQNKYMEVV